MKRLSLLTLVFAVLSVVFLILLIFFRTPFAPYPLMSVQDALDILTPLVILLSPYAPHISEELWSLLGHKDSISNEPFPTWDDKYLAEDTFLYPVSFNGKLRFKLELPVDMTREEIEKQVLEAQDAQKWIAGKTPRKVIVVPQKIINIVI